jgi:hypothetical protein
MITAGQLMIVLAQYPANSPVLIEADPFPVSVEAITQMLVMDENGRMVGAVGLTPEEEPDEDEEP